MMKNRNYIILVFCLIFYTIIKPGINAQSINFAFYPGDNEKSNSRSGINLTEESIRKNYWLPAIEVLGLNFGVWAYHRYITREGWSNIGWETISHNFQRGFEWDYDGYLINQFWHPFHGANYYNSARSNGLSFWESAPYAFLGSLTWEYFFENEAPSYNDIVNTPVTGIILGEISYRVSNLIIDESTVGIERVARELSAFLIAPMQGFNRMIRGEMWRNGASKKSGKFNIVISSGALNVFFSSKFNNSRTYGFAGVNLDYGNQFDVASHRKPFDYFKLHTELSFTADDNISSIIASGVLWDKKASIFNSTQSILGIYKEVDILINTVYKLSATSATGQLINTHSLSPELTLTNFIGVSAILMGGTNSKYSDMYGKDYNIGPGASLKMGIQLSLNNIGNIYANYKRYWIHTLSGAESEQFVGLLNLGLNYNLLQNTRLGLDLVLYDRYGNYKYFPDYTDVNTAFRVFISQNL